jgi:uncharacterized lipoprotein YajG
MVLKIVNTGLKITILLLVTTLCFSCAKKSYIDVDYRLPTTADTLTGRTVFIETLDLRSDTEIFNERAKNNSSTLPACSPFPLKCRTTSKRYWAPMNCRCFSKRRLSSGCKNWV